MGDLSLNFSRSEFACKCGCGQDAVDVALVPILEDVRAHFRAPVTINSGNRCPRYNARVGGVAGSQHLKSKAADITVQGVGPALVYAYLDTFHKGGLGEYATFTHVDTRELRTRWTG